MSRRESFVHRSKGLLPYSAIFDFPIPNCSKCKQQMVKLEGRWACKTCTLVDTIAFVDEIVDGELVRTPLMRRIPVGESYPNRAARRRA